jgi:hypothetical protein
MAKAAKLTPLPLLGMDGAVPPTYGWKWLGPELIPRQRGLRCIDQPRRLRCIGNRGWDGLGWAGLG